MRPVDAYPFHVGQPLLQGHRVQAACRDKLPLHAPRKSWRSRIFDCQTVEPGLASWSGANWKCFIDKWVRLPYPPRKPAQKCIEHVNNKLITNHLCRRDSTTLFCSLCPSRLAPCSQFGRGIGSCPSRPPSVEKHGIFRVLPSSSAGWPGPRVMSEVIIYLGKHRDLSASHSGSNASSPDALSGRGERTNVRLGHCRLELSSLG